MRKVEGRFSPFWLHEGCGKQKRKGQWKGKGIFSPLHPPPPPSPPLLIVALAPRFAKKTMRKRLLRKLQQKREVEREVIGDEEAGNNSASRKTNWWRVNISFEETERGRNDEEKTFVLLHQHYEAPQLALHLFNEYKMRKKINTLGLTLLCFIYMKILPK